MLAWSHCFLTVSTVLSVLCTLYRSTDYPLPRLSVGEVYTLQLFVSHVFGLVCTQHCPLRNPLQSTVYRPLQLRADDSAPSSRGLHSYMYICHVVITCSHDRCGRGWGWRPLGATLPYGAAATRAPSQSHRREAEGWHGGHGGLVPAWPLWPVPCTLYPVPAWPLWLLHGWPPSASGRTSSRAVAGRH